MRRLRSSLVGFGLGAAFYLLLIDTSDPPELYVAGGVGALAAFAFEVSREQGIAEASFSGAWLSRAGRLVGQIPVQIVIVVREAFAQVLAPRQSRGEFRAVSFRAGENTPPDVGRRALAEALGSLAPNTIVIGIDTDRQLLLVHQLVHRGGREQLDALDLG
jgi:multisubunit Na+/H+ antiporter MnhE subunit